MFISPRTPAESVCTLIWYTYVCAQAPDIVLGARPQHLALNGVGNGLLPFQATLSTSEQLGDQQLLDARIGETPIRVAGVDPFLRLADGTPLSLAVHPENIHLFDSKTGIALT